MKLTVSHKVLSIAAVAIVAIAVFLTVAWQQVGALRRANERVLVIAGALQAQQFADMMHDALRGDATGAVIAAQEKDAGGLKDAVDDFATHSAAIRQKIDSNRALPLGPEVAAKLNAITAPLDDYVSIVGEVVKLAGTDLALARGKSARLQDSFHAMETAMAGLSDAIIAEGKRANDSTAATNRSSARTMLAVAGGFAIGLVIFSIFVARSIPRPFVAIITKLRDAAAANVTSAGTVAETSSAVARESSEQAAAIEETSASLEEISSMARSNADNATRAKEIARLTRTAADAGTTQVSAMNDAMDAIKTSSDGIAKIIKTIDEIAFQTNILALNAAVEAARAGESGMGFAVVAEEVRALAQRSAAAAKETAAKIDDSVAKSRHGAEVCAKVAVHLGEIATKTREVDELIGDIATASQEQTKGISQVNTAIGQMDRVVQAGAARAEEGTGVALELTQRSEQLQVAVDELAAVVGGVRRASAPAATRPPPAATVTKPRPSSPQRTARELVSC
ncbi:MAG TPA: methyl-accepting chemotaxis protein [Opitutus sp.]|nr:methyl-accepting chemotaxis protein [Opitutus sp.]